MDLRATRATCLALAVATLTACTVSHKTDAKDLQDQLRDLEGVDTVTLDYVEPMTLDAADVNLDVAMVEDASAESVAEVFRTAYLGLTDAHEDEEGNLTVTWGRDTLTLRTFESEADVDDVAEAALVGAEVAARYRRVQVGVMTQRVEEPPHVSSTVTVWLPRAATSTVGDRVRAEVAQSYGDLPALVYIRRPRR